MTISNSDLNLLPLSLSQVASTFDAISKFPVNVGGGLSSYCQENLTKGTRWKYCDNVFWFVDNAAEDRQKL